MNQKSGGNIRPPTLDRLSLVPNSKQGVKTFPIIFNFFF